MKKNNFLLLAIICMMITTSCGRTDIRNKDYGFSCQQPLQNFAFPVFEGSMPIPEENDIFPAYPWKKISNVPLDKPSDYSNIKYSFLFKPDSDNGELWANLGPSRGIYKYDLLSREWSQISSGDLPLQNFHLFIDREGNIWGYLNSIDDNFGMLYKYKDPENGFVQIKFTDKSLEQPELEIGELVVGPDGLFWFTLYNGNTKFSSLISYDPRNSFTATRLENLTINRDISISPTNEVYLFDYSSQSILNYSIADGNFHGVSIHSSIDEFEGIDLFYDSEDRLWLSDIGYIDYSAENSSGWYEIIKPSIFINYNRASGLWRWANPEFSHTSSKSVLWYSSQNGTGWVNTDTGVWCIFTSFQSNVQQDNDGNLWILINGSLYKLDQEKMNRLLTS
jgi:hypothetical protein